MRKGKTRMVAFGRLQRRMRAGTTVVITVRKGNTLGKYIRLRFRRGTAPGPGGPLRGAEVVQARQVPLSRGRRRRGRDRGGAGAGGRSRRPDARPRASR